MDLLGEHLAEGAAEHREVLARTRTPCGPSTVPQPVITPSVYGRSSRPGGVGAVAGEQVELVERAVVEEVVDALAGEHLALGVLALDRAWRPGVERCLAPLPEIVELVLHR